MSNTEEIKKSVDTLNKNRYDVVRSTSNFVNVGKGLFNKTSRKQDSSGKMASTVQKALAFTSKTIPNLDLVIIPPGLKSTIKIKSPKGVCKTEPISIEFEVTRPRQDAGKKYKYYIQVTDHTGTKIASGSDETDQIKVPCGDLPRGLPNGKKYKISITAEDSITGAQFTPYPVEEEFEIDIGTVPPVPSDKVKIISPTTAHGIYTAVPISIEFEVPDSYITAGKKYEFTIVITDDKGNPAISDMIAVSNLKKPLLKNVLKLGDGNYDIFIIIKDPATKKWLAPTPATEAFQIQLGKKPLPPRNNKRAKFFLSLNGSDPTKFKTILEKGKFIRLDIQNSGDGGILNYTITNPDNLLLFDPPDSVPLSSKAWSHIQVSIDDTKYTGPKSTVIIIEALAGKTARNDIRIDIK